MDAGPEAVAEAIATAVAAASAERAKQGGSALKDALLLFGPGADMLYGKLTQPPQSPRIFSRTALRIFPRGRSI